MRIARRIRPVLVAAMFTLAFALLSPIVFAAVTTNAHPTQRVTDRVDNSKRTAIRGHVPRVITRSADLGRLPGNTPMRHMMLVLKPSFEQDAELQKLIDQQHDKRTANHHQWITPEEFGEKFGAHDSDIAQVKTWLAAQGFEVESVGKNKRIIQFSGSSGQVENAFQTEMHYFQTPKGETHISANSDIYVPTALHSVIAGVHGMNNFFKHGHMVHPRTVKASKIKPSDKKWTFGSLTSANTIVGPNDFAVIYNTLPLLQQGINGAGVKIGVIGQSDILMSDVQTYRAIFNLPLNNPNFISPGEDAGVSPGDDGESDLDVEIPGGIAPMATVDFVPGASTLTIAGVDLSLMYMVENNTDDIITSSYGGCEAEDTAAQLAFYLALSEQGAAQGQTLMVASGDSGPSECDSSSNNSEADGYAVGDNDGNAYVLSIGGTQFNEGGQTGSGSATYTGTSTFWTLNNNTGLGSALSYIPEQPWNEAAGSGSSGQSELWASNGGVGADFQTPAFQSNPGGLIPGLPTGTDPFLGNKVKTITAGGTNTGYTTAPTVTVSASTCALANCLATATAAVSGGKVTTITLTNPGYGYATIPTVTLTGGGCTTGCATATATISSATDPATPGVPGPHRYQPDLALNAAAEHDATAFCSEGVCQIDSNGNALDIGEVGGTSVAAPSYAGVQALVNQSNGGRQGMPGYVLYALAAKQSTTPGWAACATTFSPVALPASNCIFNDMVQGNTNICSVAGSGGNPSTCKTVNSTIGWPATTGYDFGTGLGSPNVANLATQWGTVTFNSSATTMNLTASGITHGTAVPVTVNVTGAAGTPSGDVAFTLSSGSLGVPINATSGSFTEEVALAQNPTAYGTLSGGNYSGNINNLPGGSYNVFARYAGDGTFGSSTSAQVPVTVLPENSTITLGTSSVSTGGIIAPATTFTYGQLVWIDAFPRGASGIGIPTGNITVSDNSNSLGTLALNSTGQAFLMAGSINTAVDLVLYQNINAFQGGSHSLTASYSGDASFNATTGGPFNFTVTPLSTIPTLAAGETQITSGAPTTITATFAANSGLKAGGNSDNNRIPGLSGPTGTVTFTDGVNGVLGTVPVVPTATFSASAAITTNLLTTSGAHSITASYSGDSNYAATNSAALATISVGTATATAVSVATSANPTTLAGRPTFTATVTGGSPQPTTGTVTFYDGTTVLGTGAVSTAHVATLRVGTSPAFVGGNHNITAAFGGIATTAAASVSPVLAQAVTLGTAPTQLTAVNGANVGQTVTLSAVVSPSSTSATYAPTGTVTFFDGATAIGTSTGPLYFISSNNEGFAIYEAQFSTSSLSAGTHVITAQYPGDVNYSSSVSNAQTIIISGASATAVLYSPTPNSNLTSNSINFRWLAGSGATKYWLDVGSTPGGNQYYQSGPMTTNNLGAVVSTLPSDGSAVYATLYSFISGNWVSSAYTFNAFNNSPGKAVIATPAPNTMLTGTSVPFTWTAGTGATAYWIDAGTVAGGAQYFSSGSLSAATLSKTVTGLPTNGSTVIITLFSLVNGTWVSNNYSYTAFSATAAAGMMSTPPPGSVFTSNSVTFTWTAGSSATAYWLDVGSTPGGNQYSQSGNLGNVLTTTVNGLPTDGSMVYVTLYSFVNNAWVSNAYTYTALNAASGKAVMQTPIPSTTLSGNSATFTWSAGTGATSYWVDISAVAPGGNDVYQSGSLGNVLTTTVNSLPANNSTIYVTLYSFVGGQWLSNAYTYTSGP